jgi:hypothetical protein
MYARFLSLAREEEADRIPPCPKFIALVLAKNFPAEHVKPLNMYAAFSSFGETLEVDPVCLSGHDMSTVKAIVLLDVGKVMPKDILATRAPWGTDIIRVQKIRVWPAQESYGDFGEYIPFFSGPPLPTSLHRRRL